MLLFARTAPRDKVQKKPDGMSVFLVDMKAALGKGLPIRPIRTMINHATTEVFFDKLEVPAENLVGEEGKGFRYILDGMNAERILIGAECIGDARWFIAKATAYANERKVFDRPIGQNQGVQFPIARAYMATEAAALILAMPHATAADGVKLYYEEAGSGIPILFVHEFAGDHRSWEPQLRFFSRAYRTIAYNARGYPPSDVPADPSRYSQARARDDAIAVLDHLGIDRAHVVGLSMGGFATLHVGLAHPQRALSLVAAGCGYGAAPTEREKFRSDCEALATLLETR